MKKLLVIALLGIGIIGIAQKKNENREKLSSEEKAEKISNKMKETYGLSDDQTKEVKVIFLKRAEKNSSKIDEFKANNEDRKKIMEEVKIENAQTKEELKKILTPEQFAKYEVDQNKRKEKIKEKIEDRKGKRNERRKVESEK